MRIQNTKTSFKYTDYSCSTKDKTQSPSNKQGCKKGKTTVLSSDIKNYYPNNYYVRKPFGQNPSRDDLTSWFKKNDIDIFNNAQLSEFILESIQKKNFINSGTTQSVYSINNNDLFVLKIPNHSIKPGNFKFTDDEFPELNIGQEVASIGDIKICKKQNGIQCSIPYIDRINPAKNSKKAYLEHLSRVQKMPQKAYDELAYTFAKLNKKDKIFDCYNPNNILISVSENKFNLVDDLQEAMNDEEKNTLISILNPLIDIRYMPNLKDDNNAVKIWREIIIKSYIASEKANLPMPTKDLASLNQLFKLADFNPYVKLKQTKEPA